MVTHSQQLTPDDESQDSNASSSVSKIFSDSESNSNSNSDLELDSEDSDNKDDSPEDFSNNDSQLPPEYYLEQAESLDISQLQQKRYSDGTQEKLDETPGKLVDTKVMGALEHKGSMSSQHLMVVDTTLTMPGATLEAEYQRCIDTINAMAAFCLVEEGRPTPQATQPRRLSASDDDESCRPAKQQRHSVINETDAVLRQAMESV
ncbi:hypothetical protein KXW69_003774 [Aspergillus fumigatus]|nr:hypothetical protein KXW69_003774 [Aspergillus fumigatus]